MPVARWRYKGLPPTRRRWIGTKAFIIDAATAIITITPSATETQIFPTVDAATITITTVPSGIEVRISPASLVMNPRLHQIRQRLKFYG
jgi:hypothetical protein